MNVPKKNFFADSGGGGGGLTSGLYAYYKLEESANSTRVDSSGNSHDLSSVGTTAQGTGKLGNCFSNNINGNLDRTTTSDFNFAGDFTFAMWVKYTSITTFRTIFSKFNTTTPERQYRFLYNASSAIIRFETYRDDGSSLHVQADLHLPSTGIWYHYIVWYTESSGEVGYKIDNNADVETTDSPVVRIKKDSTAKFSIGTWFNLDNPTHRFDGLIDNFACWNRLLTSAEKDELWNSGNGLVIL